MGDGFAHVTQCASGGQKTTSGRQFSPSFMLVLGMDIHQAYLAIAPIH